MKDLLCTHFVSLDQSLKKAFWLPGVTKSKNPRIQGVIHALSYSTSTVALQHKILLLLREKLHQAKDRTAVVTKMRFTFDSARMKSKEVAGSSSVTTNVSPAPQ